MTKANPIPSKNKDNNESSGFSITKFLKESKEELDKIVWPTRQELLGKSVSVILIVILSSTVLYLVNNLFSWAAQQIFK